MNSVLQPVHVKIRMEFPIAETDRALRAVKDTGNSINRELWKCFLHLGQGGMYFVAILQSPSGGLLEPPPT